MNDDFKLPGAMTVEPDAPPLATSSIYRLFEAFIALREKNERQHKMFEQTLNRARDGLQSSFNSFAAETQRAYQQMRQDVLGEKKFSLTLLNTLLDLGLDLQHILDAKPALPCAAGAAGAEAWGRWVEALEVENRKVWDDISKFGIHPYDAQISSPYNPALHERVGSMKVEGMPALLVAQQRDRGYASQQPEFILRRPKVVITE